MHPLTRWPCTSSRMAAAPPHGNDVPAVIAGNEKGQYMKSNAITRALAGVAAAALAFGGLALGVGSASAAEGDTAAINYQITLNGDVQGHTFKAYQLASFNKVKSDGTDIKSMELVTDADLSKIIADHATAAAVKSDGVGTDKEKALPQAYTDNPAGWVATWRTDDDAAAIRAFVDGLAGSNDLGTPDKTVTVNEAVNATVLDFGTSGTSAGWYLITDTTDTGVTLGAPMLVGTTYMSKTTLNGVALGSATIKAEAGVEAPTKTVDKASQSVNGTVTYTITAKTPSTAVDSGYVYTFVDTPSAGLKLTTTGLKVEVQDVNTDGSLKVDEQGNPVYRTLKSRSDFKAPSSDVTGDGSKTFEIALRNVSKLPAGAALRVTYTGVIVDPASDAYDQAGIATVTNSVVVKYGATDATATTAASSAAVKVYKGFGFTKIAADTKAALAGAKFRITPGVGGFVDDSRSVSVSGEDGKVSFAGLAAGTYTVTETEVPDGYYSEIKPSFEVTINENGTVSFGKDAKWDLVNVADQSQVTVTNVNSVTQLPSTGGMGIGLLATAIALAAGAGVFFSAKSVRSRRLAAR